MNMNTTSEHLYYMLNTPSTNLQLYDESDGLFGDLIDANSVVDALASLSSSSRSTNVGSFNNNQSQTTAPNICTQSYQYGSSSSTLHNEPDIPLEIENAANVPVRIRYINVNGQCPVGQTFTVDASSSIVRYVGMGHSFVLSVVLESNDSANDGSVGMVREREEVLAAYRVRRRLPSGSCHCIFIQQQQQSVEGRPSSFITEILLMDETKYDSLVVSAAALNHDIELHHQQQSSISQATISTLHKIISNIIKQPANESYRTLRLENKRVQREIVSSFGAMEMLRILGFRKQFQPKLKKVATNDVEESKERDGETTVAVVEEEVLKRETAPSPMEMETFNNAIKLLDLLKERSNPNFVEELAQPPPWSMLDPSLGPAGSAGGSAGGGGWRARRGFNAIDDDERWRRAERNSRLRRGGHGRRPNPGEAPSSRGRWGR